MNVVRPPAGTGTIPDSTHQLYLTHCLYDEGITRQAGFAVRASSSRDPLLLRFAQEYPPYEPPACLAENPSALGPPARLALVRVPGGSKALIHSVALPDERHGRANNFFSHVLARPALSACEALRLWGSPDWAVDCSPVAGKELDPVPDFERGPLDDHALTDFLRPDLAAAPGPFCPERLGRDAGHRRELLSLTLRGCLLALREPAGSPRGRFFLVAEPPLAVLLIYGAMRLLPPHLGEAATFSTSESMRPSLRAFQHARIVGTWPGQPGQALEEEFFTTRGYAFDTATQRCSEELHRERDPAIDDWLDLAEQGEWSLLDTVYRMLGNTATSVVSFHQGFQAAKLTQRLSRGKAEAADLVALSRSPLGPALLEQHREKVWPLVRDADLPDSVLREEFGDVLVHHIPELEQQLSAALRGPSPEEWRPGWRLLKIALSDQPQRLRESLQRILPPPPYSSELRFALLTEFRGLQSLPLNQQLPLHSLLRQCGPEDLARFAASDLPPEWHVWALFYALIKGEAQAEAVRQLDAAGEPFLKLFWEQFALLREEPQRRAILAPLFAPRDGKHVLLFSRSLGAFVGPRAETVEWLLDALGALGEDWADFWCAGDHLEGLLAVLRGLGDDAEPLWDRLLGHLDADLFLNASRFQQLLLANLAAARSRPGHSVPPKAAQAIADYLSLHEHFERASGVPPADRPAILAACGRLKHDVAALLRRYFVRYLLPREVSPARIDDFAEFFHSFYPDGDDYKTHASRLVGWREVVSASPEGAPRDAYLDRYLQRFVPIAYRDRLARDILRRTVARAEPPAEDAPALADPPREAPAVPVAPPGTTGFQLTGVSAGVNPGAIFGPLVKASPWLLVHFAGGLLLSVLLGYLDSRDRQTALLYSFVPLVLALADGLALQAVAVGTGLGAGDKSAQPRLARSLAGGLMAGASLGLGGGILSGGAALLFGGGVGTAASVGVAAALGMLTAGGLGATLPVLFGAAGPRPRVAVGPLVRALVGGMALGLYVFALRWLAR